MPALPANIRQRRIIQLSEQWGIVLPPAPVRLTRPQQPPSFRTPSDDHTAEDLLRRRAAEIASLRPKSGIGRAFSTSNLKKGKHWDPKDVLEVLHQWVATGGSAGVAEALIAKLSSAGVDLNGAQTQKSGLLNRRRSIENLGDKTRLLKAAVEQGQLQMVQVLAPHADPLTLDACLPAAIRGRNTPVVELLLRYGANASQTADGQDAFRQACVVQDLSDMVALVLQSDGRPAPISVSQALNDAARAQCLETVIHLSRSTADANYNNAEALKAAVNTGRRDIAVVLAMGNMPPQSPGLEDAFQILMEHPSLNTSTKLELAELLLCCGAQGDVLCRSLELAYDSQFLEMTSLLAGYGVSVEHNDAYVLKTAISRGQVNLVASLLNDNTALGVALASTCVNLIPIQADPSVRYALLRLLLRKGASGQPLDQILIHAANSGDLQSVELLLTPHMNDQEPQHHDPRGQWKSRVANRHAVASVDYKNGESLRGAVLRADADMTMRLLAGKPAGDTLSSVFPLTKGLQPMDRYRLVDLFLKSALTGPSLHAALQEAIADDPGQRDEALIDLLLKHKADINYNNGTGLRSIVLQKDLKLLSMLLQNASPQTAASQLCHVMEVDDHRVRHDIMAILFQKGASIGTSDVCSALLTTLTERPVDMSLLRLLLQRGKADINGLSGSIITKAVQNPDPKVLEMVLSLGKPVESTIARCLDDLAPLPSTDNKAWKLSVIQSRANRKGDMSGMLVREVQSLLKDGANQSSLSTLKQLLDHGADPNGYQAAALCHAVGAANTTITDLLFKCPTAPTQASLSLALPHALRIIDPMDRLTFTMRLVESGASPLEVNRALNHAISVYPSDVALIKILSQKADTSDGDALSLAVSKEAPEVVALLLGSTKHSSESRSEALLRAMSIKDRTPRYAICGRLAKAGVTREAASKALLVAARDGDLELGDMLIAHGASISSNNGQAIIEACRGGSVEVLDILLKSDPNAHKATLERGFQAATEVGDLNKRAMVFQRLLEKGVAGDVVNSQLVSAARYGEAGQEVLKVLLAAGADPNHNNGEAVVAATRSAFVGTLELLLGLWHQGGRQVRKASFVRDAADGSCADAGKQKKASPPTLARALKACWSLNADTRFQIIDGLMKAGMPATEDLHIALSKAVAEDEPDEGLVQLLLDGGASPLTNGCQTLIVATRRLTESPLKTVLKYDIPEADINHVFFEAFTHSNFDAWYTPGGLAVARMLLEKGARGAGISGSLVAVMKHGDTTSSLSDEFIDVFVVHGADVDYNSGEPLIQAASKANVSWTRRLLSCRPSSQTLSAGFHHIFDTSLDPDDVLELFEMFTAYQEGEVKLDALVRFPDSEPVLVKAMSQYPRSTKVLKNLLDAGYYHDQTTFYQLADGEEPEEVTLLGWAIAQPQKKISTGLIELLVDRGANVNFEAATSRLTPLMLAILARRPDVVKILLIDGAEVDVTDAFGRSPLSMATNIGGDLSIQMMGNLLAAEPSKDDGSLHNAAKELNLPAVRVLVEAGHDPDFPSPLHDGRSALAEVCRNGSAVDELTAEREKAMQKVMAFLVEAGSDLTIKSHGKSLLHLCFDSLDPLPTTRSLLKVAMWKHVNKPFNQYSDGEFTYSPTMYITKILAASDSRDQLLHLLKANRAIDVYYSIAGEEQPIDAVGLPADMEIQERERKARVRRIAQDSEDHAWSLARKKEIASVEQQIWANKAEMEDARRRRLHSEDLSALHSKAQVEESIFNASLRRRLSEQRALTDASLSRTKAIAASEASAEDSRRQKMLEWDNKTYTDRVNNERALSALRISEREEMERIERGSEDRINRRLDMQRKLVESQEKLAKRIAAGPNPTDARRQIGYVEELN